MAFVRPRQINQCFCAVQYSGRLPSPAADQYATVGDGTDHRSHIGYRIERLVLVNFAANDDVELAIRAEDDSEGARCGGVRNSTDAPRAVYGAQLDFGPGRH